MTCLTNGEEVLPISLHLNLEICGSLIGSFNYLAFVAIRDSLLVGHVRADVADMKGLKQLPELLKFYIEGSIISIRSIDFGLLSKLLSPELTRL